MSTAATTQAPTLEKEASEKTLWQEVFTPFYLAKMAERGYRIDNDDDFQTALHTGQVLAQKRAADQTAAAQKNSSFFKAAHANLERDVLGTPSNDRIDQAGIKKSAMQLLTSDAVRQAAAAYVRLNQPSQN